MTILVVEDDLQISNFIIKGLEEHGFSVHLAKSGEVAREMIQDTEWDLILLDIMLPGIDGMQLIQFIRYRKIYTPILVLSALNATSDKTQALDYGADDYLSKPFHFEELLSRIKALTRRAKFNYDSLEESHVCGALKINPEAHLVTLNEIPITLSPREYKLLLYLMENKNKVVSRTQILNAVWGIQFDNNTNVVDVYVSYLRTKLDGSSEKLIHTIKGTGYILKD
ncbi:response regulator transcription factor [Myroides guanonis]|uniref:DNA-binding response regulator, OmpR family, contains REC and winged-helix (WHTH) domain n=1 Tax=Myroides guanonis TaxID=1150112 RepID=A0A1I3SPI8_9FLAO|nr:response regulator transcription factor [Myroides guanonis]SFJ60092.1 DNA-binding response regulator, OmpR family, contains REC and winged-helix (wHTH) domain [Myroides guanonis]